MKYSNDDNSVPRIPPGNFNLIEHPFRPTRDYAHIEGLADRIWELEKQGRFRSALDEIFKVLDSHPGHPEALTLATILLGESRTNRLHAEEPIPDSYLLDTRLDPIYAVCSHCRRTEWVPNTTWMMHYAKVAISNPAGQQCYNCGYVVCRNCMQKSPYGVGFASISQTCPNCHEEALHVPVFPTGRPPHQMRRQAGSFVRVIIFREGPVPPDGEYIKKIMEKVSPDVLESNTTIFTAFPVPTWQDDISHLAYAILAQMELDGKLPAGSIGNSESAYVQDEYGTRGFVVKVPIEHTVDENLIRVHIARLYQTARDMPGLLHLCDALADFSIFSFTVSAMEKLIPLSLQSNKHQYLGQRFSDTIIVVSIVPAHLPSQAMTYFPGGYLATLISLMHEFGFNNEGPLNFVHWILCKSRFSSEQMLHTSLFSPQTSTANVALDLLSVEEKEQAGI